MLPSPRALAPFFACLLVACGSSDAAPGPPSSAVPDAQAAEASAGGGGDAGGETELVPCGAAPDATVEGTIKISVDDAFKLYVNGALVKEFTGTWQNVQTEKVTLQRHPTKKNVIAVEASNTIEIEGMDRMLVADLSYDVGGETYSVVTSSAWKQTSTLTPGWLELDFDDAAWAPSVQQGAHGSPPYGDLFGTSAAAFIWSFDSGLRDVSEKPDAETVYFRRTFYIDPTGNPQSAPVACR